MCHQFALRTIGIPVSGPTYVCDNITWVISYTFAMRESSNGCINTDNRLLIVFTCKYVQWKSVHSCLVTTIFHHLFEGMVNLWPMVVCVWRGCRKIPPEKKSVPCDSW